MKKLFYFLTGLLFSQLLLASNYYWVGGTGVWSDFAIHWATTSGGTVFHVTIPNPTDDVFFDANSFATSADTVYLDTTITNCHSMDWSGATNAPVFYCSSYNSNLQVYGSLILSGNLSWQLGPTYLMSKATGNVINTAGAALEGVVLSDTGSWDLQSGLNIRTVSVQAGTLRTHGYPVAFSNYGGFYIRTNNSSQPVTVLLDTSFISGGGDWNVGNNSAGMLLDADSARIQITGQFTGGVKWVYSDIVCGSFYGQTDSCHFHAVQCTSATNGVAGGTANIFHDVQCLEISASYNSIYNDVQCAAIYGNNNTFHNATMNTGTGNTVSSGIYFYTLKNEAGIRKSRGKIVVE